jgi:hypothetical protein
MEEVSSLVGSLGFFYVHKFECTYSSLLVFTT